MLALLSLLSPAYAGGSWTDDFNDNDITDWTVADGSWTATGSGTVKGTSSSHTGPDFLIDPGMDTGVTEYSVSARMRAVASGGTMGLTLDYGNGSLNCGYFHWAGSAVYKTNPATIESNFATVSWSTSSVWYELRADVDKVNETVDLYLDGTLFYSGDICNGYLNSYTATGMIGVGLHSTPTVEVDWISVDWEYVDNDGDGYTEDDNDCDDDDSSVNPGATEVWYDGTDTDCDGSSDYDADGDGYDSDGYGGTDCDDTEPTTYLGASDTWYDGVDSDCAGDSDYDADGDGDDSDAYGGTDCDDSDPDAYLGASETTDDGVDQDCDGYDTCYVDADFDGYGDGATTDSVSTTGTSASPTYVCDDATNGVADDDTDCDDGDGTVYPGATELCDGQDNDCDNVLPDDESDDDSDGYVECTEDANGWDGSAITGDEDCDDDDITAYPGAAEYCDATDHDCDGESYDDDSVDVLTWYADDDGDSYGDPSTSDIDCEQAFGWVSDATDCDDDATGTNPAAQDIPYDGIDQDCSGADLCDVDGDGFDFDGAECFGEDCDDDDIDIHPDAEEVWYDDVDQDCAEDSDYDADGDGYDSASYDGDDCDDAAPDTYPGAPDEVGDGIVTDCDGADEYDADGDGFAGAEYGGTDCDDNNSAIHPGAEESWYDGIDQDCAEDDDFDQDGDGLVVDDDCDDTDPSIGACDSGSWDSGENLAKGGGGCGCDGTGGAASLIWLVLAAVMRRRA